MSESNLDTVLFELSWYSTHICLSKVIGEQHHGLDDSRSLNQLLRCHRIRLVAWQESYVDVLDS